MSFDMGITQMRSQELAAKFKVGDVVQLKSGSHSMTVACQPQGKRPGEPENFDIASGPFVGRVDLVWVTAGGQFRCCSLHEDMLQLSPSTSMASE